MAARRLLDLGFGFLVRRLLPASAFFFVQARWSLLAIGRRRDRLFLPGAPPRGGVGLPGAAAAVVVPRGRWCGVVLVVVVVVVVVRRRACVAHDALTLLTGAGAGRDHRRRRGPRGRVDGEGQRLSGDQDDRDLALVGRGGRNRRDPIAASATPPTKAESAASAEWTPAVSLSSRGVGYNAVLRQLIGHANCLSSAFATRNCPNS